VQRTVTPVFCNLAVALKTEGRLPLLQIAGMGSAMSAVAGITLQIGHRLMLDLVSSEGGSHVVMTGKTYLSRLIFHELGISRSVRRVTGHAVTFSKWRVGVLPLHRGGQFLVTGKTQLSTVGTCFQEGGSFTSVGGMARRTLSPGERFMSTEQSHFNPGLLVAWQAKFPLVFDQQFLVRRFVRLMAVKATALFGRGVRHGPVGEFLPVMAGKAKGGRLLFQ
jgi:hypothetical protein